MLVGKNSLTQSFLQLVLLYPAVHRHQNFVHRSPLTFLHRICLDLLAIGLAPDFEYLGPCRISGLMLWVAVMPSRPALLSPQETLLEQCSWDSAD